MNDEDIDILAIPGEFICDFCGIGWDLLWSVNDGLWAVCSKCMELHYGAEEE